VSQSEKVRLRLQALDERLARLHAEKSRLVARVSQAERKHDTRRKILIGALYSRPSNTKACRRCDRAPSSFVGSTRNSRDRTIAQPST